MSSRALIAAGTIVVGAAVALGVVAGSGLRRTHSVGRPTAAGPAATPIELVALEQDRDGDRFIVRGIVRNPAAAAIEGLVAAVSVFGRDGGLVSSAQAPVAAPRLAAGAEAPFVVVVAGAVDVDRYHLSFRTAAGVVPHLDRRAPGADVGIA